MWDSRNLEGLDKHFPSLYGNYVICQYGSWWFLVLIFSPKVRLLLGVQGELLQPLHNLFELNVDVRVDRDVCAALTN